MEPSKYQIAERLQDGSTIIIRAIHPDDRERFAHAFQQFIKSPDSVRFRFHGFKRSLSESEAIYMTEVDFVDHIGRWQRVFRWSKTAGAYHAVGG